jgi:hypothetical protein
MTEKPGSIEYLMPSTLAKEILKQKPKNTNVQDYLIKYVNEQFGLKQQCVKVTIQ